MGSHLPSHGESVGQAMAGSADALLRGRADCTIRSGLPVLPSPPTAAGIQASDTHDVNLLTEHPEIVNVSTQKGGSSDGGDGFPASREDSDTWVLPVNGSRNL